MELLSVRPSIARRATKESREPVSLCTKLRAMDDRSERLSIDARDVEFVIRVHRSVNCKISTRKLRSTDLLVSFCVYTLIVLARLSHL